MNCQEVMEYMQRQLDGDLTEEETEILMNHTRHCSECAAMFERLQLLSSGLESLPKVMPSYSLVDAIMPQLQELQSISEKVSNVVATGTKESTSSINRREFSPRTERRRSRFSMRTLGGVIAAGVVVGLFITNYNGSDPLKTKDGANTSLTADAENGVPNSSLDNATPPLSKTVDPNGSPLGKTAAQDSSGDVSAASNTDNAAGASAGLKRKVDLGSELQALSPDGKYKAYVEDQSLHIYLAEDNTPIFQSPERATGINSLLWSDDSKMITYGTPSADDQSTQYYTVDVSAGTEETSKQIISFEFPHR